MYQGTLAPVCLGNLSNIIMGLNKALRAILHFMQLFSITTIQLGQRGGGAVDGVTTSQLQALGFHPELWLLFTFICSPHVCVDFPATPLPPVSQKNMPGAELILLKDVNED